MTGLVRLAIAAFFVSFSYFSCSSVEQTAACTSVCSRYADCFDEELDPAACTSDCLDDAGENAGFTTDVEGCERCMEWEGCGESAFDCFDECGKILGQSAV